MIIKELKQSHPAIYKRALECQKEQGNKNNDKLDLYLLEGDGNFSWRCTKEGHDIWLSVSKGNFAPFYKFHNIPEPITPTSETTELTTEFISIPVTEWNELKSAVAKVNDIISKIETT